MTLPAARPCEPWPAELCCKGLPDDVPDNVVAQAMQVATELCWALSGRRFGTCVVSLRPCRKNCLDAYGGSPWPHWWGSWGGWSPATPWPAWWAWEVRCACPTPCGCNKLCEITLPRGPVAEVLEVRLDGVVLPGSAYRVDNWRQLVRLDDPEACWPICQDMANDSTEPGTFEVRWRYGKPIPQAGLTAVSVLACELIKSCLGLPCDLPPRVTQQSRQGRTVSFLDPQDYLKDGKTGLYWVDLFLAAYNPSRLKRRARVRRADDDRRKWRRVDT